METITWFKMFLFLIVVGTMISLMTSGSSLTANGLVQNASSTLDVSALEDLATPAACAPFDVLCWLGQLNYYTVLGIQFMVMGIGFIVQFGTIMVSLLLFFTGITSLLGLDGTPILPSPFNIILAAVIMFMWLFLLMDAFQKIASPIIQIIRGG